MGNKNIKLKTVVVGWQEGFCLLKGFLLTKHFYHGFSNDGGIIVGN